MDNHELVVQARAGDSLAFEKLFERHYDRICLYLVYLVGSDEIQYFLLSAGQRHYPLS